MPFTHKINQRALRKSVREAAKKTIRDVLRDTVRYAKSIAPVDTGALKQSISFLGLSKSLTNIYGEWGIRDPKVHYWMFQEYGTIYHPPQPFIRPAIQKYYPTFHRRFKENKRKFVVKR